MKCELLAEQEGGILRVNCHNPVQRVIIVVIALGFGICAYIREGKKDK